MTTPVSDVAVVAAKFTAALVFFMLMWLPLLACILVVRHFTNDASALDIGTIGSTFLGILLLGSLFLSLGCFASALTRSQVTAAMISLMLSVGLFVFSFLADRVPKNDWKSQVISFFGLQNQMRDFVRGVVDTRPVVFFLSVTIVFIFITMRVIESRRWKKNGDHSRQTQFLARQKMEHRLQRRARRHCCFRAGDNGELPERTILSPLLHEHANSD
jgi:ABC-2 type transport system permease protein